MHNRYCQSAKMDQGFTVSLEDNSVIVSAVIELGTTLLCLE